MLEVGTPILGLIDNAAFQFTSRVGVTHPQDQGKGGKYFICHTSYGGDVPEGFIPVRTHGYRHWLLLRIITTPETMQTDVQYITVHAMDETFYDAINELIQYEPPEVFNAEWLSLAKRLGIEKESPSILPLECAVW